jgi:hypothetical protein
MVLFLAPTNDKAIKAVKKLEALTADEYEEDLFEMKQLPQFNEMGVEAATPLKPVAGAGGSQDLDRLLSLVDAFIVRNDIEKASQSLNEAERYFGTHPELAKRVKLVHQRSMEREEVPVETRPNRARDALDGKIEFLRGLLERVERKSQFT